MKNINDSYKRVTAQDGFEYICPSSVTQGDSLLGLDQLDECIEAEVVGRYIGNLNIIGTD